VPAYSVVVVGTVVLKFAVGLPVDVVICCVVEIFSVVEPEVISSS